MENINKVIKELESLKGATVKVFGQNTTLAMNHDELTIDSIDLLSNFKSIYDYELNEYNEEQIEELFNMEENYEHVKSDNTYNWNSPLSNHMDFTCYKDNSNDSYIYEVKFHLYGDVRSNYSDVFYLRCDDDYEFYEIIMETQNYFEVEVDDVVYNCTIDSFSENVRVSNYNCDYDFEIYAYDIEELKEEIKKEIA